MFYMQLKSDNFCDSGPQKERFVWKKCKYPKAWTRLFTVISVTKNQAKTITVSLYEQKLQSRKITIISQQGEGRRGQNTEHRVPAD